MIDTDARGNRNTPSAKPGLVSRSDTLSVRNRTKLAQYIGRKKQIGRPVTGWDYHDVDGNVVLHVIKYDDLGFDGERVKTYVVVRPIGDDWVAGDPPGLLPLYRLPTLACVSGIYIVEGEKCVDALCRIGLTATTSSHGAYSAHRTDWTAVASKQVFVLPDADVPGEQFGCRVVRLLARLDPQPVVRMVPLNLLWRTNEPLLRGYDVVDWLAVGVPDTWDPSQCQSHVEPWPKRAHKWI